MADNPLPREDQLLTVVSVRSGDIYVKPARAIVVKETTLALQFEAGLSESQRFERGQSVTVLYTNDSRVLRLRAVVRETIGDDRLTAELVGDVKGGDRRDFRRADLDARVLVRRLEAATPQEARLAQQTVSSDITPDSFEQTAVNISGSGLNFSTRVTVEAGDYVDVRVLLPPPNEAAISAVGEIVRATPVEGAARFDVALRFAHISEADQDLVVYTVFSKCFEVDESLLDDLDVEA